MLIIEFTNDRIKLLAVSRRGQRIVLSNLIKKDIDGMPDEAVSSTIRDLLIHARIKRPQPLVICIPRNLVTVRNLRLPSVDDAELKNMVNLQVGKQLPYSVSELIWDFKVIEKRPDGYSDIFLAMVQKTVIDRFVNILAGCRLKIDRIILDSEALLGWRAGLFESKSEQGDADRTGAVVDIDNGYINIIVSRGNRIHFSRSFLFKDSAEETAYEITKTLSSYEKESAGQVAAILLTGIEERANRLLPFLKAQMPEVKMEFAHPLAVLSSDYRQMLTDYLDLSRDTSFSCIFGVAYSFKIVKMDFLSPEDRSKKVQGEKRKALIKTGVLLSAIALVFLAIFVRSALDTKKELDLINRKIAEIEPRIKRLKSISQNLDVIKRNLDTERSAVDVIREIYNIVSSGISISVLDFELDRTLTLRGGSPDLSSVFKFSSDIEKSKYFKNCEIKYAQKRMVKGKEVVDFEIGCKFISSVAPLKKNSSKPKSGSGIRKKAEVQEE